MLASGSVFDLTGAAQSQTAAADKERQDAERKLIREVAEGLKKKAGPAAAAVPKNWKAGANAVGRPGHRRRLHEQRRERHPVRAPRRVRGAAARRRDRRGARQAPASAAGCDCRERRAAGGSAESPAVLVGDAQRAEQPRLDGRRSAGRPDSAADAGSAAAGRRARRRAAAQRPRPGRFVRGPQLVRSMHLTRPARVDDAGDLRQLLRDPPGTRLRGDPLRDDS